MFNGCTSAITFDNDGFDFASFSTAHLFEHPRNRRHHFDGIVCLVVIEHVASMHSIALALVHAGNNALEIVGHYRIARTGCRHAHALIDEAAGKWQV